MGTRSGARVCRDERFTREPSLETALAYEAIFQKPVRELFGGLYQRIEGEVADRAKALGIKVDSEKATRQTDRTRQTLTSIITNLSLN